MPSTGESSSSQSLANEMRLPDSSASDKICVSEPSRRATGEEREGEGRTAPRDVDLVAKEAASRPPALGLVALRVGLGRRDAQVGLGRARRDGAHAVPALLPVAVGERHGDEVVLGPRRALLLRRGPALRGLCGGRLARGRVQDGRDEAGERRALGGEGRAVACARADDLGRLLAARAADRARQGQELLWKVERDRQAVHGGRESREKGRGGR